MDIDISESDLAFEEEVLRNPYKLKGWLRYLDHKRDSPVRTVSVIYERALRSLPGSYKLWHMYLGHRTGQLRGKNPLQFSDEVRKTELCFERALLLLHKMPELWLKYIRFMRVQADVTRTRRVCDRALRALPVTQHARVWRMYLRFAEHVGGHTAHHVYARYLRAWPEESERLVDYCESHEEWNAMTLALVKVLDNTGFRSSRGTSEYGLWVRLAHVLRVHARDLQGWDVERVMRDGIGRFADQAGALWAALGEWHAGQGDVERARDVYEEAVTSVRTVRDFALVFDAYAEFEQATVAAELEHDVERGRTGVRTALRLVQLERLLERRAFLASDVELREIPHSVRAWLRRAGLWRARADDSALTEKQRAKALDMERETFAQAVVAVDPRRATEGHVDELWLAYARSCSDDISRRAVLDAAVAAPMGSVAELAHVYVTYAEHELARGSVEGALRVLTQATAHAGSTRVDYRDESVAPAQRVFKSQRVWALLVDVYEADGRDSSVRSAYERMIELRIATPQTVVNYARYLEERACFEDSFRAYERGIAEFGYPVAIELWNIYLKRFVDRFGGSKLERTRDLFEQALDGCPSEYAKPVFVAYGQLEETYGLARRALRVYERATRGVANADRLEMYRFYIAKTAELVGVAHTRAVYERGISELGDVGAMQLSAEYAQTELQLGEVDRARALLAYAAQFADPRTDPRVWQQWHDFEVQHGSEDSFKEMLRVKRSVQARATDARHLAEVELSKQPVKSKKPAVDLPTATANPDEVAIDDDDL
ncbi:pre-mRNA-splicing factor syf1 [Coemansia sp. RSA 720]|nr:pre-mRNA-splicing factor syf1 [Coemansia sp. RSA 720]